MINRQIILDTETTGLQVEKGHRIIEIGCIELINRKITRRHFHQYINPQREVEPGAFAVHGLSDEFLQNKPIFNEIVNSFLDFIKGAELIIHNAPFDLGFLNHELKLAGFDTQQINSYCQVTDTLALARQLHVGQRNSLDALCKRYGIDLSKREFHGALLDANLLAEVYLAMTGGQGNFFDGLKENIESIDSNHERLEVNTLKNHSPILLKANEEELETHMLYLKAMQKKGKCQWLKKDITDHSAIDVT